MKRNLWIAVCALGLSGSMLFTALAAEPALPPGQLETPLEAETSVETAVPVEEPAPTENPAPVENALPVAEEPTLEEVTGTPVLVGLYYGGDALPGANLMNGTGKGYRLGYLEADRSFRRLAYTDVGSISVVKTQNVWLEPIATQYRSYSDQTTSDTLIGCWHVRVSQTFADYESAAAYAGTVDAGMAFPAWIGGEWQVRVGAFATREEAVALASAIEGSAVVGTSSYGVSVVRSGTAKILFQFDGGADRHLAIKPGTDDSEKNTAWFRGRQYYGLFQYRRVDGGNLTVANLLDIDDYAECVISREMSPSWPVEALKAQAVCARTYYHTNLGRHNGFDICSTMHCQAYYGMGTTNARTRQAAVETSGLGAWYKGKAALTVYFSSDGGATEDVKNVWGSSYDYLKGVIDPYEESVRSKIIDYETTVTYTPAQLASRVRATSKGTSCGNVVDVQLTMSPTGNVQRLTVVDDKGASYPFTGESGVRNLLGLRSMHYWVEKKGGTPAESWYADEGEAVTPSIGLYVIGGDGRVEKITGSPYVISGKGTVQSLPVAQETPEDLTFVFHVTGWGHNVGMSQWGAYAMAVQGKTFEEILKFYYTGIEIY